MIDREARQTVQWLRCEKGPKFNGAGDGSWILIRRLPGPGRSGLPRPRPFGLLWERTGLGGLSFPSRGSELLLLLLLLLLLPPAQAGEAGARPAEAGKRRDEAAGPPRGERGAKWTGRRTDRRTARMAAAGDCGEAEAAAAAATSRRELPLGCPDSARRPSAGEARLREKAPAGPLQELLSRLQDWLLAAEETARAACPAAAHASYAEARKELRRFEALRGQVSAKLWPLDALNRRYQQLGRSGAGDGLGLRLRAAVREVNQRWEALQARAAAVSRRLKHFVTQWEEFETEREALRLWLTELSLRLMDVEHFSGGTLLEKMTRLQAFQEDVQANAERMDRLLAQGERLIQKSQPEDAELLEEELQDLSGFCQEIFCRVFCFWQQLVSLSLALGGFRGPWEQLAGSARDPKRRAAGTSAGLPSVVRKACPWGAPRSPVKEGSCCPVEPMGFEPQRPETWLGKSWQEAAGRQLAREESDGRRQRCRLPAGETYHPAQSQRSSQPAKRGKPEQLAKRRAKHPFFAHPGLGSNGQPPNLLLLIDFREEMAQFPASRTCNHHGEGVLPEPPTKVHPTGDAADEDAAAAAACSQPDAAAAAAAAGAAAALDGQFSLPGPVHALLFPGQGLRQVFLPRAQAQWATTHLARVMGHQVPRLGSSGESCLWERQASPGRALSCGCSERGSSPRQLQARGRLFGQMAGYLPDPPPSRPLPTGLPRTGKGLGMWSRGRSEAVLAKPLQFIEGPSGHLASAAEQAALGLSVPKGPSFYGPLSLYSFIRLVSKKIWCGLGMEEGWHFVGWVGRGAQPIACGNQFKSALP
ncbi:nesprin-4 isoform X3 [Pogona vitticeps]